MDKSKESNNTDILILVGYCSSGVLFLCLVYSCWVAKGRFYVKGPWSRKKLWPDPPRKKLVTTQRTEAEAEANTNTGFRQQIDEGGSIVEASRSPHSFSAACADGPSGTDHTADLQVLYEISSDSDEVSSETHDDIAC